MGVAGGHAAAPQSARRWDSGASEEREPPEWVSASPLLDEAFSLAALAHGSDRRPSDGRPFLEHVTEVAELLQRLVYDEELVAVGLLHDSVERGRLSEADLREAMGDAICAEVMALSEDPEIGSFEERKAALREQVRRASGRVVTVFAADKLSDVVGLRRGVEESRERTEARLGTSVAEMTGHYRESVELVASARPGSAFLSALRRELDRLEAASP